MVYAWALEQSADSKLQFPAQDCLVPWHVKADSGGEASTVDSPILQRFCHVFRQGELEELVELAGGGRVQRSFFDHGNWCVVVEKEDGHPSEHAVFCSRASK